MVQYLLDSLREVWFSMDMTNQQLQQAIAEGETDFTLCHDRGATPEECRKARRVLWQAQHTGHGNWFL